MTVDYRTRLTDPIVKNASAEKSGGVFFGLSAGMRLFAACAVVGQDTGGGVFYIAALPRFVRHPEVLDHVRLTGIVFLKNIFITFVVPNIFLTTEILENQ